MPSAENLYQVAQFFGVSVEWLLTGKGDEELNQEREKLRQYELEIVDGLNFQERKLIELFRQLDEQNRNAIMLMANSLIKCSH